MLSFMRRLAPVLLCIALSCGSKPKNPAYHLLSAEHHRNSNPWTFSIPRKADRKSVKPGRIVKLIFQVDAALSKDSRAERMWVIISSVEKGRYVGALDNDPVVLKELKAGDRIEFGPEHICAIEDGDDPAKQFDEKLMAMVSKEIIENGAKPLYLIRENSTSPAQSGWWLSSTEENLKDREAFLPRKISDLLKQFGVLDTVLHEPTGSEFIWDESLLEYRSQK